MLRSRRNASLLAAVVVLSAACERAADMRSASEANELRTDWPTYGQDKGGQRFSTLRQIDTANVADLEVAWTYHMKPAAETQPSTGVNEAAQALAEGLGLNLSGPGPLRATQVTPLVVGDAMYFGTPYGKVVALDATSGTELWTRDLPEGEVPSRRGVEYWPGDDAGAAATIFVGTQNGLLIALDAASGAPVERFGTAGVLDVKTGDVLDPAVAPRFGTGYSMTSPPLVYEDMVITAAANGEFPTRGARGTVRAWDARTAQLLWSFAPVPETGGLGADTWAPGSMGWRRGVSVWGFMTVDVERGIVYLPFGAPAWDRYGGDRVGANLFSSSLVAVDAHTGEYLWHFQTVHHDIWDYDLSAPPALFDIERGGTRIPAVAVTTKSALLFIFDRVTGEPVFGVEERPVPASRVPGEASWPTQPFPVRPEPLGRNSFSIDEIATVTAELTRYCREWIAEHDMQFGGPYLPIGYDEVTVLFPGFLGGSNWHGASFSPDTRYLYANISNLGQVYSLTDATGDAPLPVTSGSLNSRFYWEEQRLMCQQPPWGELVAVNVDTGEIAWRSPLGVSDNVPEADRLTGRPNIGGSIATAGGLVFVGATDDARFRAFDAATGVQLWETELDAAAHATPITYLGSDDRQYVAVSATGGSFLRSPVTGDSIIAWRLPDRP